jgi:L-galactose dehydrogenase
MQYRTLGKTGLSVSILGFGGSPLGSVFRPVEPGEAIRTVRSAIDGGINFFDTSPFYGRTRAESVLGMALAGVRRDRFYLATKVGRYDENEFEFSAERVTRSLDESLERLKVEYVDLIQCHDIEYADLDQIVDETIPALRKIQASGKARFIGITGYPLKIFPYVLSKAEVDCVLTYCHYSLNNTSLRTLFPTLAESGVGIINAAALSMGLLTNEGPPAWHPAPHEIWSVCKRAAEFCRERGKDIAELALQFAFTEPSICTTLVGMASIDELKRNLKIVDTPPDRGLLGEVQQILAPIRNQTWSTTGQLVTDEDDQELTSPPH